MITLAFCAWEISVFKMHSVTLHKIHHDDYVVISFSVLCLLAFPLYSHYKDIYFSNTVCTRRQTTAFSSNQQTAAAVATAPIGSESYQSQPFPRSDQSEVPTVSVHPAPCTDVRITWCFRWAVVMCSHHEWSGEIKIYNGSEWWWRLCEDATFRRARRAEQSPGRYIARPRGLHEPVILSEVRTRSQKNGPCICVKRR